MATLSAKTMKHELWIDKELDEQMFCLSGPHGEDARAMLGQSADLVWCCDADTHFEAMTKYYNYMDWGIYTTGYPEHDHQTYKDRGWE